jgi:predicted DNA-binding transcriptional regulator YafY
MEQDTPAALILSAHAMGFDGLRWHIRAWCHERLKFRDFAIGRLVVVDKDVTARKIDPHQDLIWETKVNLVLVPHPDLNPSQREVVIKDYNMVDGRLVLPCRQAMLFYTLRHLNLLSLIPEKDPARQHVIVDNPDQVREWLEQDRKG